MRQKGTIVFLVSASGALLGPAQLHGLDLGRSDSTTVRDRTAGSIADYSRSVLIVFAYAKLVIHGN